ncbi:MAG: DUF2085 domain-containing protein [Actinomycetota bacterium]|nr:DUF2085 domain-containing protein [Actinomycetota bacterium]
MFNSLIEIIGFSVCHQLSSRSLIIGKIVMPVCARCSGIYAGFIITAIILLVMYRKKENGLPPLYVIVILALFFLSALIDGIASNFGIYETNNNLRFITGFLCGSSIMIILYPIFTFQYYRQSKTKRIFNSPCQFIIYILIITVFILVTLIRFDFMGSFYYYFVIFSILFTFYFINMVLVLLVPPFSQKADRLASKYLILPSIIAIALSSMELLGSYWFHGFIMNFRF